MSQFSNFRQTPPRPGFSPGFNLLEVLIALSLSTIVFMATVSMFVKQSDVMNQQSDMIDMNREGRFALEHLRRDLASLGSNATPHSDEDPLVCPKPAADLPAISLNVDNSYVVDAILNPFVVPVSIRLFGSMDVKTRWHTAAIDSSTVILLDEGTLPATADAWNATFTTSRYLRLSNVDGTAMYFPIASSNFGAKSIVVNGVIPRQGEGQACGFLGAGANLTVDVQGFVRYRIIADSRPGAPRRTDNVWENTLMVRERMGIDGTTVDSQTILAENVVDLAVYDMWFDLDSAPELQKISLMPTVADVVQPGGQGLLGSQAGAHPEQLRAMTIKLTVRSMWPLKTLVHQARSQNYAPLDTWKVADDQRGIYPTVTLGGRVSMPTMVSRNL